MSVMDYERKNDRNDDVYTKVVKAGKRTYFFDIKSTKSNDLYLTLTESKKATEDGREYYQKHKLFLYKEDFDKFVEGLQEVIAKVEELKREGKYEDSAYFSGDTVDFDEL